MNRLAAWWRGLTRQNKVFTGLVGLIVVLALAVVGQPPRGTSDTTAALPASQTPGVTASPVPTIVPVTVAPVVAASPDPTPSPTPEATPTPAPTPTPEPTPKPTPTPRPTPKPTPVTYQGLTSRSWAQLVKAPDNYIGERYKLWGCISQFDAATGSDSFRAQASYRNEDFWFSDGENTLLTGDADQLAEFVTDDVVFMNVVVLGSFTYDTQAGGSTTVPWFSVEVISRRGSC